MYKQNIYKGNAEKLSKWILALLGILTLLEVLFFPEPENIYGCLSFIVGWGFLAAFVMKQKQINKCFIPFIAMFGIGICFFFMPLMMTLVEGKPLTFRFNNPYDTFNYQLIYLLMLILAYRLCLRVYKPNNKLTSLWEKIGYFSAPNDRQIWALGIIGIISQVIMLSIMGTDDAAAENLGAVGHLLGVLKGFACFPVLLLFKNLYSTDSDNKVSKKPIIIYLVILAALGAATGKRTMIFSSFVTILMCYITPFFTENKKLFTRKTFVLLCIGVYLVTGPVADFAAAMALGRDNSERTSASRTFDNIIRLYQDKEKLNTMYKAFLMTTDNGGDNLSGWSEYYVDNIMMDRFCNLRVCDMTISYAQKLGYDNPTMHDYMSKQVLFLLPTPVLEYLGIHVNKFEYQYTPGDLLSMESLNIGHYHGYRVAGDVGTGLYLWGHMFYVYAFFIYFALFYFLSSMVKAKDNYMLIFPLPILAEMFRYYLEFNNATGVVGVVSFLLRTGWQTIIVYCLIKYIICKIVK